MADPTDDKGAPTGAPSVTGNLSLAVTPVGVEEYVVTKDREKIRGRIALGLVGLVALEVLLFIAAAWSHCLTIVEVKDIASIIFTPTVGLASAATAFYFAGKTD